MLPLISLAGGLSLFILSLFKNSARGIKPVKEFVDKVTWVLSWKNPAATILIFLVCIEI